MTLKLTLKMTLKMTFDTKNLFKNPSKKSIKKISDFSQLLLNQPSTINLYVQKVNAIETIKNAPKKSFFI